MSRARLVPTTLSHIEHVAKHMRESDRMEVWASTNDTPMDALTNSVALTDGAETVLIDEAPACICGVARIPRFASVGVPWMLGTAQIESRQLPFLRLCREWIQRERAAWPLLLNYSDARAVRTHRWLQWLGFTLYDPTPFGVENMMFRRFELRGQTDV